MSRLKLEPSELTLFRLVFSCVTSLGQEGKRAPSASICFQLSEPRSMLTSKNAIELAGAACAPSPSVPAAPAEPPPLEPPQPAAMMPQAAIAASALLRVKLRRMVSNPP